MNTEELEASLHDEARALINTVIYQMREEVSKSQKMFDEELQKHKSDLEKIFDGAVARLDESGSPTINFREITADYLRLARDEGSRITALAIEEAEEMGRNEDAMRPVAAGINELTETISAISRGGSQGEILKTLLGKAGQFAPRGAFLLIKNEYFVGWKMFGSHILPDDVLKKIALPVASNSILGEAARALQPARGPSAQYPDDRNMFAQFDLGVPSDTIAVPLVVRGRSVGILYADGGLEGGPINTGALETMVRVAGMTVEILAAAPALAAIQSGTAPAVQVPQQVQPQTQPSPDPVAPESPQQQDTHQTVYPPATAARENIAVIEQQRQQPPPQVAQPQPEQKEKEKVVAPTMEQPSEITPPAPAADDSEQSEVVSTYQPEEEETFSEQEVFADTSEEEVYTEVEEAPVAAAAATPVRHEEVKRVDLVEQAAAKARAGKPDAGSSRLPAPDVMRDSFIPKIEESDFQPIATTKKASSRLSKQIELPIEVEPTKRHLHNDARRFARLVVQEIKMYNKAAVAEGVENGDLYDRLKDPIERSREIYEKRRSAEVAAVYDYLHFELVNILAEGDETLMGESYPGKSV